VNPSLVVTAVGQKTVKPTNEKIGAKNGQDQAVKKLFSFDLKCLNVLKALDPTAFQDPKKFKNMSAK
jgi:hypothetical protein